MFPQQETAPRGFLAAPLLDPVSDCRRPQARAQIIRPSTVRSGR